MGFFVDETMQGPRAGTQRLSAPAVGFVAEPSPRAGATLSQIKRLNATDPHAWHLTDAEAASLKVLNHSHYRAKMFIRCAGQRCPGRMQLHIVDVHNQPLERAFYRCERRECRYHDLENVLYPEEMSGEFLTESAKPKPGYKSNESLTRNEMEGMI
jgi:hypothetical protein